MDIEKIRRLHRAKEQRSRLLRGEIIFRPEAPGRDARIVRIVDYKARKARQVIWENEPTAGKCTGRS
jgi:hypothetical protein